MIAKFKCQRRAAALAGLIVLPIGLAMLIAAQNGDGAEASSQAKAEEASAQYRRTPNEFPGASELAGRSQPHLSELKQPPPCYLFTISNLLYPGGVAADSAGNIYVSDTRRNRIKKFNSDGALMTEWGGAGAGAGALDYPQGLAVDGSDNIYVADTDNHRVQKFTADGKFVRQWGEKGKKPGEFNRPYNVATDRSGSVYVVDSENGRVQKFTGDGLLLEVFGAPGNGEGQLRLPQGVAVDGNGVVYVGDGRNGRVAKFAPDGRALPGWKCIFVHDVAVDAQGNVYVANAKTEAVQMFSGDGTLLTEWGSKGTGPGQFDFLARVAVDSARSRVLVTDAKNNRVQIFGYSAK